MNWFNGLSSEEKQEIYADSCAAYQSGVIKEIDFRKSLAELHYNATDIEDLVKFYRPPAPEREDDYSGG